MNTLIYPPGYVPDVPDRPHPLPTDPGPLFVPPEVQPTKDPGSPAIPHPANPPTVPAPEPVPPPLQDG